MADWIAVDETTRQALHDALGPHGEVSIRSGSALKAALDSNQDCAILLPAGDGTEARLVSIQRFCVPEAETPQRPSPPVDTTRFDYISEESGPEKEGAAPPKHEQQYEATGFLGLNDEAVYDDEPDPPKKAWWKKLVE